jgi:hypothetical protein
MATGAKFIAAKADAARLSLISAACIDRPRQEVCDKTGGKTIHGLQERSGCHVNIVVSYAEAYHAHL